MKAKIVSVIAVLALCICSAENADSAEKKLHVYVSIPPQTYFVKAIGGRWVEVSVMVQPQKSPASYEPSPKQMVKLAQADIYFAMGVPFEAAWMDKFSDANPEMPIIQTAAGIQKKPIHRHGGHPVNENSPHKDIIQDPHVWLSPPLMMLQARHILQGMRAADPQHSGDYENNFKALTRRLIDLDIKLMRMFHDTADPHFMVFHPSWGYFADAYGLHQIAIEIEGKTPKAKEVAMLIELARNKGISVIFVQPQFPTKQAQIIAKEIGGAVVMADPLAEDWENNLIQIAHAIKQELE